MGEDIKTPPVAVVIIDIQNLQPTPSQPCLYFICTPHLSSNIDDGQLCHAIKASFHARSFVRSFVRQDLRCSSVGAFDHIRLLSHTLSHTPTDRIIGARLSLSGHFLLAAPLALRRRSSSCQPQHISHTYFSFLLSSYTARPHTFSSCTAVISLHVIIVRYHIEDAVHAAKMLQKISFIRHVQKGIEKLYIILPYAFLIIHILFIHI